MSSGAVHFVHFAMGSGAIARGHRREWKKEELPGRTPPRQLRCTCTAPYKLCM